MKYMGSKNRIAKEILPIILQNRGANQCYVEPFCGGLGTLDKVDGYRIASDKNKYLIAMWIGLQNNRSRPRVIPKDLYDRARTEYNNGTNIEFDDFLIGWIGWMASFNGRFFDGGYSGVTATRNYIDEQIRNTERQIDKIQDVVFISCDYRDLLFPDNSIIYCDIPYKGTKQYSTSKNFNHSDFWQWVRDISVKGHEVFVSEYDAPEDFVCVWDGLINSYMKPSRAMTVTERLYRYNQL